VLNKEDINKIKLFVLDMDGTFYIHNTILDGSLDFIKRVKDTGKRYLFLTNNSSRSSVDYIKKLKEMNCHIDSNEILSSGDVTIDYLHRNYPDSRIYLVGTKELEDSFRKEGICIVDNDPDIVVVGYDTSLTYEKLEKACNFINKGAKFIGTHMDIKSPADFGFIPDCGSICAIITYSTGINPIYMGKPSKETVDMIVRKTGYSKDEIAFVGDRLYTDIAAGVNNGCMGILVLTGEATLEEVKTSDIKPDLVFESLKEMSRYLH
jgi:HAD superfamily hydrolase (TIGR01457 family)